MDLQKRLDNHGHRTGCECGGGGVRSGMSTIPTIDVPPMVACFICSKLRLASRSENLGASSDRSSGLFSGHLCEGESCVHACMCTCMRVCIRSCSPVPHCLSQLLCFEQEGFCEIHTISSRCNELVGEPLDSGVVVAFARAGQTWMH